MAWNLFEDVEIGTDLEVSDPITPPSYGIHATSRHLKFELFLQFTNDGGSDITVTVEVYHLHDWGDSAPTFKLSNTPFNNLTVSVPKNATVRVCYTGDMVANQFRLGLKASTGTVTASAHVYFAPGHVR